MNVALTCPYCDRPLRWIPLRWFGRGCYECDQCGEFPDLRDTRATPPYPHGLYETDVGRPVPKRSDRPRVLLVDDSAEHCDLYALMLEPTATVVTVSRGEAALALAAKESFDAIVLDVLMPGMDGWEVCSRLKGSPTTRSIPVIMLTSLDGSDLAARAERVGAAAMLMKPCAAERLALAIDAAVRERIALPQQAFLPIPAQTMARRWTRKTITVPCAAQIEGLPAQVVNVSYGGMCIQVDGVERTNGGLSTSFDVTFLPSNVSVRAGAVWLSRSRLSWLCGAEVSHGAAQWRTLVDQLK
jgi:CheY-like chemotaxis protein